MVAEEQLKGQLLVIINLTEEGQFSPCEATIASFVRSPESPCTSHDGLLFCHVPCEQFAELSALKIFYGSRHLGLDSRAECGSYSRLNKMWDVGTASLVQQQCGGSLWKGD